MGQKPRAVTYRDGRIGFPAVVEYELTGGPEIGTRLPVPPSPATHPDPESATPPPLSSREAAKTRAEWDGLPRSSLPYLMIVHDQDRYDELVRRGFIYGPQHCGPSSLFDNRPAPQS